MSHDLRLERLIDGSPEEVFDAFTDSDAMLVWYQENPDWVVDVVACDVRVGGTTIVSFGPSNGEWHCREEMTYTEVARPNRLVYDEVFGAGESSSFETVVAITFEDQDGKTLFTLVQTGFPSTDERDAHQGGWPGFIDRLERVVVGRRTS